jgi:hypothetical protein
MQQCKLHDFVKGQSQLVPESEKIFSWRIKLLDGTIHHSVTASGICVCGERRQELFSALRHPFLCSSLFQKGRLGSVKSLKIMNINEMPQLKAALAAICPVYMALPGPLNDDEFQDIVDALEKAPCGLSHN